MSRKQKEGKYVMSQSELKALKDESTYNRQMLKQAESEKYGAGTEASGINKAGIEKQAKHYEAKAAQYSAPIIKGAEKDRYAKRAEELRSQISEGMPTRSEMNDVRGNPGAPMKNLQWEKRNAGNIREYKQVMRTLDHHDPMAGSVERFRRGV